MADDADRAGEKIEADLERQIAQAAKPLAEGVPGECEWCGEHSGRLIGGACAPCRERYKLP